MGVVAIAALIVVLVVLLRGDDDDDAGEQVAVATSTVGPEAAGSPVPAATPPAGTTPTPEGTGGADGALEAFIADEFTSEYFGECPQEGVDIGEPVSASICTVELYRSETLVTFLVGALQGEGIGEAVITRDGDGPWSVNFVDFGPLGESVSLGSGAVVYGAGNCLNFRDSPSVSGEVQSCQIDGTTREVVDGPQEADDHTWWKLEGLGWSSGQYLRPVVE